MVCCASIPANKIYILYIHLALFRNIPHNNSIHDMQQLYNLFLVGGFNPLKNICQLGLLFPIYGEIKMFQTFPNHPTEILYIYAHIHCFGILAASSEAWSDVMLSASFNSRLQLKQVDTCSAFSWREASALLRPAKPHLALGSCEWEQQRSSNKKTKVREGKKVWGAFSKVSGAFSSSSGLEVLAPASARCYGNDDCLFIVVLWPQQLQQQHQHLHQKNHWHHCAIGGRLVSPLLYPNHQTATMTTIVSPVSPATPATSSEIADESYCPFYSHSHGHSHGTTGK